jgi:hypothetical protein
MVGMSEFEDQALGFLVRGLMARLRPHAVHALRPLGLGLPEFVCMRILDEDPGRTGAELARHTPRPQAVPCRLSSPARAVHFSGARRRP